MSPNMLIVFSIDWTNVIIAGIVGLPAIIAAVYSGRIHRQVKTPSGKSIGKQVEDALHTAISNYHFVNAISEKVGAEPSPQADGEAQKVKALTEPDGDPA